MISMKSKYQDDAGRTAGTSCKHVKGIIKDEFNNDWGTKVTGGGGRRERTGTVAPTTTAPSNRRAAIAKQLALNEQRRLSEVQTEKSDSSLMDRISALEATRG
jgi:hypothetical protein